MSGRKLSVLEGVETEEREVSFSAEMKGDMLDTSLETPFLTAAVWKILIAADNSGTVKRLNTVPW